ncbi:MAG TPA: phosphatase PAP2 family protein [Ilumatobacteraceae bacterium]
MISEPPRPIVRALTVLALVAIGLIGIATVIGKQLHGATSFDARISDWFLRHRTSSWNEITSLFSRLASTPWVVGMCLIVIAACVAIRPHDSGLSVLVVAMLGELAIFLSITALVERARPTIPHLDAGPPTSSFPSGHTFATFVLWGTLCWLAHHHRLHPAVRVVTLVLAVMMPISVGLSRIYRGMHHPTDVLASLILGGVWLTAVVRIAGPCVRTNEDRHPQAAAVYA